MVHGAVGMDGLTTTNIIIISSSIATTPPTAALPDQQSGGGIFGHERRKGRHDGFHHAVEQLPGQGISRPTGVGRELSIEKLGVVIVLVVVVASRCW